MVKEVTQVEGVEREEGKGQGAGKRSQKDANLDSGRLQVSLPSLVSFSGA